MADYAPAGYEAAFRDAVKNIASGRGVLLRGFAGTTDSPLVAAIEAWAADRRLKLVVDRMDDHGLGIWAA